MLGLTGASPEPEPEPEPEPPFKDVATETEDLTAESNAEEDPGSTSEEVTELTEIVEAEDAAQVNVPIEDDDTPEDGPPKDETAS